MLTGVAYSTAYRYRTMYGEYRNGRIGWRVREALEPVCTAHYAKVLGRPLTDTMAELAATEISDVPGLDEDIRDTLKYYHL